jgi:transcriptional regulator with XRE-family HTH domain
MKTKKWFGDLLESFAADLDFHFESLLLDLTESISRKMKEKNINRTQLAELLKISPPAVTKILNGSSNFKLRTLLSIADALDLGLEVSFREKKQVKSKLITYLPSATSSFPDYNKTIPKAYSDSPREAKSLSSESTFGEMAVSEELGLKAA